MSRLSLYQYPSKCTPLGARIGALAGSLIVVLVVVLGGGVQKALAASNRELPQECLTDYHISTHKVPHHLSPFQMRVIQSFLIHKDVAGGWNFLAFVGDGYAKMARDVVRGSRSYTGAISHALIRSHWIHTTGLDNYERLFSQVAFQHFTQYLEILDTGYWPDSDQILMSYIHALKLSGIDGISAFDVHWQNSILEPVMTWQHFVELSAERSVYHSKICRKVDSTEANFTILADFLLVLPESLFVNLKSLF